MCLSLNNNLSNRFLTAITYCKENKDYKHFIPHIDSSNNYSEDVLGKYVIQLHRNVYNTAYDFQSLFENLFKKNKIDSFELDQLINDILILNIRSITSESQLHPLQSMCLTECIVNHLITYDRDTQLQSTKTSLKTGTGDCKDKAFFMNYLLDHIGIPSNVISGKIHMYSYQNQKWEWLPHAWLEVNFEDKEYYWDPTANSCELIETSPSLTDRKEDIRIENLKAVPGVQ